MNEQKSRTLRSRSSQNKSPQRRVSFSKPWTPTKWPSDRVRSKHGTQDKAHPMPRASRPILLSKPSSKFDKPQNNKGVTVRIKKHDASSSTTVDTRRRSSSDPTPAHLKYGMFRRFSKLRKPSDIIDVSPPSSPKRRSLEIKPILQARSISRQESAKVTELPSVTRSMASPPMAPMVRSSSLPPPRPQTKHVNLSRTDPIHLDIKPKRFPSMLWC